MGTRDRECSLDKESNKISSTYLVTYAFNVADHLFLTGHSLSPFIDAPVALMTHLVVGKEMRVLVRKHWPFTFSLVEGRQNKIDAIV
jgi:hypothetical protein